MASAAVRQARCLERDCIVRAMPRSLEGLCVTFSRAPPHSQHRERASARLQQRAFAQQRADGASISRRGLDGRWRLGPATSDATYKVLFAILAKLSAPGSRPGQLEAFLRTQPTATSIPFISWLAYLEAAAVGPEKQRLGSLCGLLVGAREALDAEGQGELYAACVAALGGGNAGQEGLLVSEPDVYAAELAEAMTGQEVVREGFSPGIDALLAVAPAAALTPEGIRKGHELATELAADMRTRRRRSFAAVVGRTKLTADQEEALLKSSPAARILDMLLALPTGEQRLALLPDCFEPPPAVEEAADAQQQASCSTHSGENDVAGSVSGAATAASGAEQGNAADVAEEKGTDELWCTPLQLLNEVDMRLRAVLTANGETTVQPIDGAGPALLAGGHGMVGQEYVAAMQQLDAAIRSRWLESLPVAPHDNNVHHRS